MITKLSEITFTDNVEISNEDEYDAVVQLVRQSGTHYFNMLSDWKYLNQDIMIVLHGFRNRKKQKLSISNTDGTDINILTPASEFLKNYEKC